MENRVKKTIFVLKDKNNALINDIDTDQIFHNKYLSIVDIAKMGQYSFDNLKGYEDFAKTSKKDMIAVAGENFGSGSSRQQAVDCFVSLGMYSIAALSFGAIYKRNAINSGFPIIEITDIDKKVLETGRELEFDFGTGEILHDSKKIGSFKKFSAVQNELIEKKGLLNSL